MSLARHPGRRQTPRTRRLPALISPAVVTRARLLATLAGVVFLVLPLYQWRHHTVFQVYSDFGVYRRTAQTLARGSNIYASTAHGLPFTYPPFAAIFVAAAGGAGRTDRRAS